MRKNGKNLKQLDQQCLWHPYTKWPCQDPLLFIKGKGSYLYEANGQKYLDGISSWWVNLHGHCHPYIAKQISKQLHNLEHVLFAGCTHLPAIRLAKNLLEITPGKMSKVFFSDNGSTAVEVALKLALQYWKLKRKKKKQIVCFRKSYHGDTFGAMSAAGKNEFNKPFWSHLFEVKVIDPPFQGYEERSCQQLRAILEKQDVACFIFEPLILGAGGMHIFSAEGLNSLLKICQQHETITIADEVMTGFGRTGTLFACQQLSESVDVICLSKGLTGGFLPLGATLCKKFIHATFKNKIFLHGHSYTANPLACQSALASIKLLLKPNCQAKINRIAELQAAFCKQWQRHPKLKRCESIGTILVLEYAEGNTSYFHKLGNKLYNYFLKHNILLRPLGNILYVMPPYCMTEAQLKKIHQQIAITLETGIPAGKENGLMHALK